MVGSRESGGGEDVNGDAVFTIGERPIMNGSDSTATDGSENVDGDCSGSSEVFADQSVESSTQREGKGFQSRSQRKGSVRGPALSTLRFF